MNDNPTIDETGSAPEQEEINTPTAAKPEIADDPFFSTGHFSMHHQPADDEIFIGE